MTDTPEPEWQPPAPGDEGFDEIDAETLERMNMARDVYAQTVEESGIDPLADARPHSRSCEVVPHPHGIQCELDCPTCGGRDGVKLRMDWPWTCPRCGTENSLQSRPMGQTVICVSCAFPIVANPVEVERDPDA